MRTLHRVRTVYGPKRRIVAVLSYDSMPGRHGTIEKNVQLYGERVRPLIEDLKAKAKAGEETASKKAKH